jgi:hypothetical protein
MSNQPSNSTFSALAQQNVSAANILANQAPHSGANSQSQTSEFASHHLAAIVESADDAI